jgi:hypothetical protein
MMSAADDLEMSGHAASDIETGYASDDIETGAAPTPDGVGVFDPAIEGVPMKKGDGKFFMVRTAAGTFYACVHAESELGNIKMCLQLSPAAAAKLLSPAPAPAPVAVGWMSPADTGVVTVGGFNLFHAIKDAGNAIHKAGDFLKIPGWNVTTALLTGHNPIHALAQDVHNFESAGGLAAAVASGNYGKAFDLATNGGKIFHPDIPPPAGRQYHHHAIHFEHPEAVRYHHALIAPPSGAVAPPENVGWFGPAQTVVGLALDHEPGTLEHDASPVVRALGHVADQTALSIASAAAHHRLDPETHESARLVARAHLGDEHAKEHIAHTLAEARGGHPDARRRADSLHRGERFVAAHVDMPRVLANAIPIPASGHSAQSALGMVDPHLRFARSVDALRRGDLKALRAMSEHELAEMRGAVSLVPGMGSGVTSAMGTGETLLHGGHSLEEALRAAYGAIPVPAGMRATTDTVLETVFSLVKNPHALTDGSLAIARDRIPSGVPRDVFDTLIHVVAKHQPIGRDVKNLRGHYVLQYTQGMDRALEHGMRHVLPSAVSTVLRKLPHHKHKFAQVHPGLKEIAHVAEELRAGYRAGPPSGLQPAAPTTGARGGGRGGYRGGMHGGFHHGYGHGYPYPLALPPVDPYASANDGDGDSPDPDAEATGYRRGGFGGRGFGGRRFGRGGLHHHHHHHPDQAAQQQQTPEAAPADDDDDGDGGEATGIAPPGGYRGPALRGGVRPGANLFRRVFSAPHPGAFAPHMPFAAHAPFRGAFAPHAPFARPGVFGPHAPYVAPPSAAYHGGYHPHAPYHPYIAPPGAQQPQAPLPPQQQQAQAPATDDGSGDASQATPDPNASAPDDGSQAAPAAAPDAATTDDGGGAPEQPSDADASDLSSTSDGDGDATDTSGRGGRGGFGRGRGGFGRGHHGGYPYPAPYTPPDDGGDDAGDEQTSGAFDLGDPMTTGLGVIIPGTYHPSGYADEQTSGAFDLADPETTGGSIDMDGPETVGFGPGELLLGLAAIGGGIWAYDRYRTAHPHATAGSIDIDGPETTGARGGFGGRGGRGFEHLAHERAVWDDHAQLASEQALLDEDEGIAPSPMGYAPYQYPEWDHTRSQFHGRR